jgi:methanogenic corrinoid protein MtbC1
MCGHRATTSHRRAGVPAGEAARLVLAGDEPPASGESSWLPSVADDLRAALNRFDEAGAQAALDALVAGLGFETIARDVLLPYLRELGERWQRGEASIAQEHFASVVLRGRLLALGRGWDRGVGPRALLACAPGEQHELGLIIFGLALRQRGWRITYLGADTPIATLEDAARELAPAAVVLVSLTPERLTRLRASLAELAQSTRLLLGGAGAREGLAREIGAQRLSGDPVAAAGAVAASLGTAAPAASGRVAQR